MDKDGLTCVLMRLGLGELQAGSPELGAHVTGLRCILGFLCLVLIGVGLNIRETAHC